MNRFPCLVLLLFFAKIYAAPFGYVSDNAHNVVTVFDVATNAVTGSISIAQPKGLVVSPDGSLVYVAQGTSQVGVISAASNAIVSTILVGGGGALPWGIVITPDGKTIYVTDNGGGRVFAISTATNSVVATITVGAGASGIAITPDGSQVYVGNHNSVSVILTASNTVTTTIPVTAFLAFQYLTVTPDGSSVYISSIGPNQLDIIDVPSETLSGTSIPLSSVPAGIIPAPLGSSTGIYVAASDGTLNAIDIGSNTIVSTISGFSSPAGITALGINVYVANQGAGTVSAVSTSSQSIIATTAVSPAPYAIAFGPLPASTIPGARQAVAQNTVELNSQINTTANTIAQGGGTPLPVNGPVPQGATPSITGSGNYSGVPNVNMGVFRGNCY